MPYKLKTDGRYFLAMKLSKQCRQDGACRHCEGEWFNFGTLKPDSLFSFSQNDRRLNRTLDANWMSNHQIKNLKKIIS